MKILIIDENYPLYIKDFYEKNNINGLDYKAAEQLLLNDHFANNGSWVAPLSALQYEVTEVYANNKVLQNLWQAQFADETGKFDKYKELTPIFLQIGYYRPDIIYVSNPHVFNADVIEAIKQEFSFIKLFVCYLGTPYTNKAVAGYDLCFTTLNKYSSDLRDAGKPARTLLPSFNREIYPLIQNNGYEGQFKLCFAGGIVRNNDMHSSRLDYLEYLAKHTTLEIYSEIYSLTLKDDLKENISKKTASAVINLLRKAGFSDTYLQSIPVIGPATRWKSHRFKLFPSFLKQHVQPPIYGMDMYTKFSQNKIVFNIHVDNSGDEAANMRLFEATGAGACLLTDSKATLPDLFIPDEEVVVYSSKEECLEKVKWLLDNPAKCKQIAQAGQQRTLKDHTNYNRAIIFSEEIQKTLAGKK